MAIYGKTWWGQQWLKAFNGIDDDSRLPRGKTYANTGKVDSIKINGSRIEAKVRGSWMYNIKIKLQSFTQAENELIAKTVNSSPSIISALANKKLPEDLCFELEKQGINLFPKDWDDIDADCDCPDYAVPCKHIAAVLYMVIAEIDKNPFLTFTLHDCDLLSMIGDLKGGSTKKITLIEDLFDVKKVKHEPDKELFNTIGFSKIEDVSRYIFGILKPNPVFFDKDFTEVLAGIYKYWNKHPNGNTAPYFNDIHFDKPNIKPHKDEEEQDYYERKFLSNWEEPQLWKDFIIAINNENEIKAINLGGESRFWTGRTVAKHSLLIFFRNLPPHILHKFNYNIQYLFLLYKFSARLLEKSALIPQILQNKNGKTLIRWGAALFDDNVNEAYKKLCLACPNELIIYDKKFLSIEEQVKSAIGIFLSALMIDNLPSSVNSFRYNIVFKMFFDGSVEKFKNFNTVEYGNVINQWLSILYLTERNYKLYLKIKSDKDDDFTLDLQASFDKNKLPQSVSKLIKNKKTELLADISLVQDYIPALGKSIDEGEPITFSLEEFSNFFLNILPLLRIMGISIILPKSLQKLSSPRLTVDLKSKQKLEKGMKHFLTLNDIVNFDWKVALGDKQISIEEFKKLLKQSRGIVKIANEYVIMDEGEIQSLLKKMDKLPENLTQNEILQGILSGELEEAEVNMDAELDKLIQYLTKPQKIDVPENLKANLRPYQERGFSWLMQNINCGFGSILADDMGLGKTLQIITTALHLKNNGLLDKEKVLIVAPTSLLFNWEREIEKFAPSLSTLIYHGNNRELEGEYDVAITSYGLIRRDEENFNKKKWFMLVIDEAQNIKNPITQQTKTVKSIKAIHKVALTGTPVENRLFDYWSIFDFTNKHYLGSAEKFKKKFVLPIENDRDTECLDVFKKITTPFILRRLKSDKTIINDLPDKIENNCYCSLTAPQTAMYQETLNATLKMIDESEGIERKGLVLKLINSLKQICNHPVQFRKKAEPNIDESGKMQMLMEILQNIEESGEKVLIFTQYVEMGEIITKLVEEKLKTNVMFLHGSLTRKARDEMVDDFQNNSQKRIFIVSLKAGGTGLNLTAAKHVIHYDLWWNPAVENQATDRAYRIGQKENVMVHRFITTGTFEEKINEMIKSKKELAELTVGSGESFVTEMSGKELKKLLSLRK